MVEARGGLRLLDEPNAAMLVVQSLGGQDFVLSAFFGAVSLALAAIGLYSALEGGVAGSLLIEDETPRRDSRSADDFSSGRVEPSARRGRGACGGFALVFLAFTVIAWRVGG